MQTQECVIFQIQNPGQRRSVILSNSATKWQPWASSFTRGMELLKGHLQEQPDKDPTPISLQGHNHYSHNRSQMHQNKGVLAEN